MSNEKIFEFEFSELKFLLIFIVCIYVIFYLLIIV